MAHRTMMASRHFSLRRYSLRTLLALLTLLAVGLGWWSNSAHQQRLAVEQVAQAHGRAEYDFQVAQDALRQRGVAPTADRGSWAPRAIVDALGIDFFHNVLRVDCYLPSDEAVASLACLPKLERLSIPLATSVTDAGVIPLGALGRLEHFELRQARITDASLLAIGRMTRLKVLTLASCTLLTDEGIGHLKNVRGLTRLDLALTGITDQGLAALEGMTELEQLDLSNTAVRGPGLAHLAGLPKLKSLKVRVRMTDDGMAALARLTSLETLDLRGSEVTPAGLARLQTLPRLKSLALGSGTPGIRPIDDEDLTPVGRLVSLEQLELGGTSVTPAGLEQLRGLANLKELRFGHIEGDYTPYQQALPKCRLRVF